MKIISDISTLREFLAQYRGQDEIALVPTMGNLHAGHLQLVRKAQEAATKVIVSIFVNPLQFAPTEDFKSYPRTLHEDIEKLKNFKVDAIFVPEVNEIYGALENHTQVSVPIISDDLCGIYRPHFFYGVTTVVAKLFNIVQPDIAIFGEKDFQQLQIIKRMVRDLCFPIKIISVPTKREPDGLAMSSRNQYLNDVERIKARQIYQTLCKLKEKIILDPNNFEQLVDSATETLAGHDFKVDYICIRNQENLAVPSSKDKDLIILVAAWLGKARLIDNIFLHI